MRRRELSEEQFLKEVDRHVMTIKLDTGLYRHLNFSRPKTNCMSFDIVTYPGYLCYSGDMGSFLFSRISDMIEFFRGRHLTGKLDVNPQYWAEKLQSLDRQGGYDEYSPDEFRRYVTDRLKDFREHIEMDTERLPDHDDAEVQAKIDQKFNALKAAIELDVLSQADEGEREAYEAMRDFEHDGRLWFPDYYEARFRAYTYRYEWCCYALVWAIRQYDIEKESRP